MPFFGRACGDTSPAPRCAWQPRTQPYPERMATAPVVLEQQPGAATSPIAPAVAAIKTTLGDLINDVLTVPPAGNPAAEATDGAAAAEEPYYWEAGVENPPPAVLVTHNLHWAGMQLVAGMEYIGEVFSEFFGLTNSRYEWAVQAQRNMQVSRERRVVVGVG